MKKIVSAFLILVFCAAVFLFISLIYSQIDKEVQADYQSSYMEYISNVDTTAKKWLNGYLGIFFRFRYFGNVNWLAIPLIIYFLFTIKTKKRWQIALVFMYIISALLLGIKGFYYWRYQYTLYPITIALVMFLGWEYLKNKNFVIKVSALSFVAVLALFNFYHYFDNYKFQWTNKTEMVNKKYPTQVLKYINEIDDDNTETKFLVCGAPHIFFYYSNKSAIPFYSPEYQRKSWRLDRKSLHPFLKNVLNVKYVFSDWKFDQEMRHSELGEILDLDCKKIVSDRGYQLYLLRDRLLEDELKSKSYGEYKVWDLGSIQPETTSLQPEVQGIRGKFNFEFENVEGRNILSIRNTEEGKNGERIIQFGYTLNDEVIEAHSLDSKFVYFFAEAKIPGHLIDKENYIFIQDYDGKWERTKIHYAAPRWRNYLVYKKIRPHSNQIGIGFKFLPQSEEDELQIRNIKIYFLDQKI